MKKLILWAFIAALTTCVLPPPAAAHHGKLIDHLNNGSESKSITEPVEEIYELRYPTLFLLQWTYQCSQAMQPQFEMKGMPSQLALQFSIQQCSCVIDEFRQHYLYEDVISMDFAARQAAAEKMARECLVGVNTDKQI